MVATRARAELRLDYAAPSTCPAAPEFHAEFERSMRGSELSSNDFAYAVNVQAEADGYRGTLRVLGPTPSDVVREVSDRDCREVVQALAFIAAVLADPGVAERNSEPLPAAAPSTTPAPAVVAKRTDAPAAPKGAPARARRPDIAPKTALRPPERARDFRAGLSAAVITETGLQPDLAWGPRLGVLARRGSVVGALSVTFGESDSLSASVGEATLQWLRGRLEGCAAFPLGSRFELLPCLSFDGGFLEGRGSNAPFTDTRRSPWLAPGALGRAAVSLGQVLEISAEVGGSVPLFRPSFVIETAAGEERVHTVPGLAFSAGLRLVAYLL
jgi:hypothetical protein